MEAVKSRNATLQDLLSRFEGFGDAPALISVGAGSSEIWSFRQLAATVEKLAAGLSDRGVSRGDAVALLAPNGPRWAAAYLAALRLGAVAMPLDERMSADDALRLLGRNGCRWIATTGPHAERLMARRKGAAPAIIDLDDGAADGRSLRWSDLPTGSTTVAPEVAGADVAMVVHTSGTTGTPKAVPLTHANLMSNVDALGRERLINAGDRALLPLPLHHVYPLTVGLLTPLAAGATVVFPAGVSGPELATALREASVTHLVGVPRLYTALLAELHARVQRLGGIAASVFATVLAFSGWLHYRLHLSAGRLVFGPLRRRIAPRLRLMVSGGAALEVDAERELEALGWEVLTGYGLTETSPILAFNRRDAKRVGTVGQALPGVELRIATPAADGIGEIQARGASVFAGYREDPEATKEAFESDGWFRTGDLGFIDRDGYLHVTGRRTETIVLPGGKKVNPETIEKAYAGVPVIRELAALAPDGTMVALVVPDLDEIRRRGSGRAEAMIREALAARGRELAPHERFGGMAVTRGPLPRTQLGKLRRHLLPPLYARAREGREPAEAVPLSAEDRDLLAQAAAQRAWEWLKTRFPGHQLTLDTSPQLELGIDSLGWINLSLDMQRSLGVTLTEAAMARVVTVRDLLREASAQGGKAPEAGDDRLQPADFRPPAPSLALRLLQRVVDAINRAVLRTAFGLRAAGLENLPVQPCVICPNHASFLDPFALAAALPYGRVRRTWWAGWTGLLFSGRLRRGFSRLAQVLPVDPDRGAASALELGSAVVAQGFDLVWFPEGVRSADGHLQQFLPGIGAVLERTPVPVVPAAIMGSFEAWPRHRRLPGLGRVRVVFGPPQTVEALKAAGDGATDAERIAAGIRAAVASLMAGIEGQSDRRSG